MEAIKVYGSWKKDIRPGFERKKVFFLNTSVKVMEGLEIHLAWIYRDDGEGETEIGTIRKIMSLDQKTDDAMREMAEEVYKKKIKEKGGK